MATARLLKTSTTNAFSTTLNGSINDSDSTITLTTTTGLQAPGVICIDRQNSSGANTPNVREYISFTGISVNNLTGCTRGLGGSNAQSHLSGALVEELFSVSHWLDLIEYLAVSHDSAGKLVTSTATITTARILTNLNLSGASVSGDFPLNPLWSFYAAGSTPTVALGKTLNMPQAGLFKWFSVTLSQPASGATMILDVNNNGTSIFDAVNRPMVPLGGTYVSTASIATTFFSQGNKITVDVDQIGAFSLDTLVQGRT